jgi:hypothetical protein
MEEKTKDRPGVLVFGVILILGLLVRVRSLGSESFWHDESWSWGLIRGSFGDLFHTLIEIDAHPPLYYLLLKVWSVVGTDEFSLRMFSVLLGVAALPLMYRIAARFGGPYVGLGAMMLLVFSPYHVLFSQEARSYSLLFLLCLCALELFLSLRENPVRWKWIALSAVSAGILYTHYMGAFFLLSLGAGALLYWNRPAGFGKRYLIAMSGGALLFLPWIPAFMGHITRIDQDFWIGYPTLNEFFWSMGELVVYQHPIGGTMAWTLVLPFYVLACLVPAATRKREHVFLLILLFLPVAAELLVSLRRPVFYPRTFFYVLAPLFVLVMTAVSALGRIPRNALLVFLVGSFLPGLLYIRDVDQKENWRDATDLCRSIVEGGSPLLLYPGDRAVNLEYYAHPDSAWVDDIQLVGSGSIGREQNEPSGLDAPEIWLLISYGRDGGWHKVLVGTHEYRAGWKSRGIELHRYVRR